MIYGIAYWLGCAFFVAAILHTAHGDTPEQVVDDLTHGDIPHLPTDFIPEHEKGDTV